MLCAFLSAIRGVFEAENEEARNKKDFTSTKRQNILTHALTLVYALKTPPLSVHDRLFLLLEGPKPEGVQVIRATDFHSTCSATSLHFAVLVRAVARITTYLANSSRNEMMLQKIKSTFTIRNCF